MVSMMHPSWGMWQMLLYADGTVARTWCGPATTVPAGRISVGCSIPAQRVLTHSLRRPTDSGARNNLLVGFKSSDFNFGQQYGRPLRVKATTEHRVGIAPSSLDCPAGKNHMWVAEFAEPVSLDPSGRASRQQGPVKFGSGYGPALTRGHVRHGRGRPSTTRQPPTRLPPAPVRRPRQTPLPVDMPDGSSPIAALRVNGGHCSGHSQQCGWAVRYGVGFYSLGGPQQIVFVGEGVQGFTVIRQLATDYGAVERCRYVTFACVLLWCWLDVCGTCPSWVAVSKPATHAALSSTSSMISLAAGDPWMVIPLSTLSLTRDCPVSTRPRVRIPVLIQRTYQEMLARQTATHVVVVILVGAAPNAAPREANGPRLPAAARRRRRSRTAKSRPPGQSRRMSGRPVPFLQPWQFLMVLVACPSTTTI